MFVRERLDEEREGVEVRTAWSSSSRSATLSTLSRALVSFSCFCFGGGELPESASFWESSCTCDSRVFIDCAC